MQLLRDLAVVALAASVVSAIAAALCGSHRTTGAAVCLGVILSSAYPALANALDVAPCTRADAMLGVASIAVMAAGLVWVSRKARSVLDDGHGLLRLMALACLAFFAYSAVVRVARAPRTADRETLGGPAVHLPETGAAPDIIHVIFDGLGRLDLLQSEYGIDSATVRRGLESRGLRVSEAGVANYAQTYLAVASTLSMEYLDAVRHLATNVNDRTLPGAIIDRSTVVRALKARGYRFTLLSSGYEALSRHPLADDGILGPTLVGHFEGYLLPHTPLRMLPIRRWTFEPHRARIRSTLAALEEYQPGDRPRVIIAHVLLPHPPFTFDAGGGDVTPGGLFSLTDASAFRGRPDEYRRGYGAQARFALATIMRLLDRWNHLPRKPIVIVHGDHGPGLGFDTRRPLAGDTHGRMSIFLGLGGLDGVPPPRSPVNIYRTVFRHVFGVPLSPLPDRSFVSGWGSRSSSTRSRCRRRRPPLPRWTDCGRHQSTADARPVIVCI